MRLTLGLWFWSIITWGKIPNYYIIGNTSIKVLARVDLPDCSSKVDHFDYSAVRSLAWQTWLIFLLSTTSIILSIGCNNAQWYARCCCGSCNIFLGLVCQYLKSSVLAGECAIFPWSRERFVQGSSLRLQGASPRAHHRKAWMTLGLYRLNLASCRAFSDLALAFSRRESPWWVLTHPVFVRASPHCWSWYLPDIWNRRNSTGILR